MSWICVAFGQPIWSEPLSMLAAAFGYALFWRSIAQVKRPFWVATFWFLAVQMVQIRWLASGEYMGSGIYVVYAMLCAMIGIQFGWLTAFSRFSSLGAAGFWVCMEWLRTVPLTGFTWNPVGLSLASSPFSIQFASLFGIYGLSFWVIWVNLLAAKAKSYKGWALWAGCACLPYLFGACQIAFWESRFSEKNPLSIALVHTELAPEEKDFIRERASSYIPPIEQWRAIASDLKASERSRFDLLVLPEGAVPWTMNKMGYSLEAVRSEWIALFGPDAISDFPSLEPPFARGAKVSNAFWAQSLANHFRAELIVGLLEGRPDEMHNSAFHFLPRSSTLSRYDKRVLVPVGEYVPLKNWKTVSAFVTDRFDIGDSFEPGAAPKIFSGLLPIGISICSEEVYGHLSREERLSGAELLVNISNDAWFPGTLLPQYHSLHGKIRAVENGVCLIRSCNGGVTGAVDCFGREVATCSQKSVLAFEMSVQSLPTLYTLWGDAPILISSLCLAIFLLFRKKILP